MKMTHLPAPVIIQSYHNDDTRHHIGYYRTPDSGYIAVCEGDDTPVMPPIHVDTYPEQEAYWEALAESQAKAARTLSPRDELPLARRLQSRLVLEGWAAYRRGDAEEAHRIDAEWRDISARIVRLEAEAEREMIDYFDRQARAEHAAAAAHHNGIA